MGVILSIFSALNFLRKILLRFNNHNEVVQPPMISHSQIFSNACRRKTTADQINLLVNNRGIKHISNLNLAILKQSHVVRISKQNFLGRGRPLDSSKSGVEVAILIDVETRICSSHKESLKERIPDWPWLILGYHFFFYLARKFLS